MTHIKITRNPYLLFLPFLFLYVLFILVMQKSSLWGDEIRHFDQARNILHGFFSSSPDHIEIRNGPGYPLLIVPFLLLKLPLLFVKLLNAVFLYFSIVLLYKSLAGLVSFRINLVCCLFWGCYYNSLDFIAYLYSESFSVFLLSLVVFLLIRSFTPGNSKKYIYLSGITIGYLALTKVIFGYVILCLLIAIGILWLVNRSAVNYKKSMFILLISLATTIPYLAYTYHETGRMFYWGTSGGDNMYFMSSPYENEYGSWFSGTMLGADSTTGDKNRNHEIDLTPKGNYIPGTQDSLKAHHLKNYQEIYKYQGAERDDAFKKIVAKNIRSHPFKFLQNCFSNVGRMLFNFPYSYAAQKPGTLARLPLNGAIVLLMLFCMLPTFLNWKKVIYPIRFMLFFALLYFGGNLLGSADARMFTVMVPLLLLWIAYIIQQTMTVKLKFNKEMDE